MKKQILFIAVTISAILFSCSKEKIETPQTTTTGELSQITVPGPGPITIDPLGIDLAGWFKFNGDLKDQMGKLADGQRWPLSRVSGATFTYDRKGIANAALKFDGNYYVTIANAPVQQNMSLSLWVRKFATNIGNAGSIVRHNSTGMEVNQLDNQFWGRVMSYADNFSQTSIFSTDFPDTKWHHIVITYSADRMKMYVDNQLQGNTSNTFTVLDKFTKYLLGYAHGSAGKYWKGEIDDLRFYNRTLTATDVQALYNY